MHNICSGLAGARGAGKGLRKAVGVILSRMAGRPRDLWHVSQGLKEKGVSRGGARGEDSLRREQEVQRP